jgi:hypothetical protein
MPDARRRRCINEGEEDNLGRVLGLDKMKVLFLVLCVCVGLGFGYTFNYVYSCPVNEYVLSPYPLVL